MGRRTSGQTVGLQTIGNVQANANTLTTTQTNQNLTIDPNGTGTVDIQTSISITGDVSIANQGDLRLLEASGNGTNYIAQQAAANMAANYTITWPAAVSGTSGFVLTSDTSGNLSWASAGGNIPVGDAGSTATVHYPLFGTSAGSIPTTLSPLVRSNLSFVPSTGDLRTSIVTGGTTSGVSLTLRSTTDATKGQVYIDETTTSTSATTGALRVGGGVGIGGATFTTGKIKTTFGSGADLTNSTSNMEIEDTGGTSRPSLAFHRPGVFATKITLNTDNAFYFGGWSAGSGASPIVCGGVNPGANNSYDLGTTSLRWRNIYTQDLQLSNGIGDYTIVEGEDDLFIYNNKKGKVYKFALIEVDPNQATPKGATGF
jgi:hypothetical protein